MLKTRTFQLGMFFNFFQLVKVARGVIAKDVLGVEVGTVATNLRSHCGQTPLC